MCLRIFNLIIFHKNINLENTQSIRNYTNGILKYLTFHYFATVVKGFPFNQIVFVYILHPSY